MRFAYASSVLAAAWVVAALAAPDTNFFLFPIFVGMGIPVVQRIYGSGPASQGTSLAMGTAGFVHAALTTLILSFTHNLNGEPLGFLGSTFTEGLALGFIGALLGAAIARTSVQQ